MTHYAFAAPDPPDFLSRYLMSEASDYAQQTSAVNAIDDILISELRRVICYNQSIYDDLIVELDEYSGLTLGVRDKLFTPVIKLRYDQAAILILDNDRKKPLNFEKHRILVSKTEIPRSCGGYGDDLLQNHGGCWRC